MAWRPIPARWRPPLLLAALALAALIALWLTPVLEIGLDQPRREKPSPRLAEGRWLGQVFQADRAGLCRVELALGTFHRRSHNPARFELIRLPGPPGRGGADPAKGRLVFSKKFSRSADNGLKSFSFSPQTDSKGGWYLARLVPLVDETPGSIIVWTAPASVAKSVRGSGLVINGRPTDRAAAFRLVYRAPLSKTVALWSRLDLSGLATPAGAFAALAFVWLASLFFLPWRGVINRAVLIGLPLAGLAAWLIWGLGAAPRGLEATYHARPEAGSPPARAERYFPVQTPGVRIEKRIGLIAADSHELPKPDQFGITWRGRLIIPRPGNYTFAVASGGQTRLTIDGRTILKIPPFTGLVVTRRVEVELPAGARDFKLVWLKKGGPSELNIRWGPSGVRLGPLAGPDLLPPDVSRTGIDRLCLFLALGLMWAGVVCGLALLIARLDHKVRGGSGPVVTAALLVGLIALALRLIYLFQAQTAWLGPGQDFHHLLRGTDQNVYLMLSRGVLKGFYPWLWHQPFTFSPSQTFSLAGIQALAGQDLVVIRLGLHLAGVATCLLVWDLGRRLWGPAAGMWAGLIWALSSSALVYESSLLMAGPLALALTLAAWLLVRAFSPGPENDPRPDLWLKAGLALGMAASFRGNVLLVLPFIALAVLLFRHRIMRPGLGLGLVALGLALVMMWPLAWNSGLINPQVGQRTASVAGHGGRALWVGNNPRSTGFSRCLETPELKTALARGETTFRDQVKDYVTTRPLDWLGLMWTKTWRFFNGWEPPTVLSWRHIRDHVSLLGLPLATYALICALGLAGLILAVIQSFTVPPEPEPRAPGRNRSGLAALTAVMLGYAASLIVFYVTARYRLPVQPLLAVFSGLTLACLGRGRKWAGLAVGLIIACYLGVNWDQLVFPPPEGAGGMWRWWDLSHRIGG